MARYSHRHRHSHRRRGRKMAGGSYSSATTYGQYVNGSSGDQYNRVFDQAGAYGQIPGNTIIGAQGQNIPPSSQVPNASQLALIQKAGRRHRSRRSRKGGFFGEVVNQAIVPFSLLALQNTYRRKRGGSRRTRRHHRY